jgi:hypothetical protein
MKEGTMVNIRQFVAESIQFYFAPLAGVIKEVRAQLKLLDG